MTTSKPYWPPPARRKFSWWIPALAIVAAGLAVALVAVLWSRQQAPQSSQPSSPAVSTTPAAAPTTAPTTVAVDPYEVYLANNPDPTLVLSREDAQARAYLGCGTNFAPGTIDAVLADAYRPTGLCG